jgi:hypothetical protein
MLDTCTYTYRIRPCTYMILTCQYRILTCKYYIRTESICPYLYVSARILVNASLLLLLAPLCSPAFAGAAAHGHCSSHARMRAVAACRAVAAASLSRGQRSSRQIINKFIWTGQRQQQATSLEQQRLCFALKCLGAVVCQRSTSRRQRNNIYEQNNNFCR